MEAAKIMKGAAIGGAGSGAVNTVLYFIGGALGAEYMMLQPGATELAPIPVFMPFIMSLMPALIGGGVLVALNKFAPDKAWTIFKVLVGVGFAAMLPGPFLQMKGDTVAIVVLEIMHVLVAVDVIRWIKKIAR